MFSGRTTLSHLENSQNVKMRVIRVLPRTGSGLVSCYSIIVFRLSIFHGGSTQLVSQFSVNFPSVADGEDPDHPCFATRFVNDAETSDFESPQP
jgi:hypothetical protein